MARDDRHRDGTGGKTENAPLKGGEPIDPKRRDQAPHPTDAAEKRSSEVQAGKHSDGTHEKRGGGVD